MTKLLHSLRSGKKIFASYMFWFWMANIFAALACYFIYRYFGDAIQDWMFLRHQAVSAPLGLCVFAIFITQSTILRATMRLIRAIRNHKKHAL